MDPLYERVTPLQNVTTVEFATGGFGGGGRLVGHVTGEATAEYTTKKDKVALPFVDALREAVRQAQQP